MDKDFMQYVYTRCSKALMEDAEYMELEHSDNPNADILQAKAEELCYIQGFNDAMRIMLH